VQKVEVLQYGDEPVIEPGQVMVRVILAPTGEDPHETLRAFEKAHGAAIEDLRQKVARKLPVIGRVQFTLPAQPGERGHLITSGIVASRAEGVRWALTRIRERPAYAQLREHIGTIDELKAQL
jgi:hypothetical protein